ncbi:MAG: DUF5916 domain-containing protein [Melioribacteraceae bacterium]
MAIHFNRIPRLCIKILLFLYIILFSVNILAQENILTIQKIDSKIIIDGIIDEPIWDKIKPLAITQKTPNAGDQPTQKTEIRIAYDNEYLYLSGRCYDTEPEKIVANVKKRDHATKNTEWCGFMIDSYNDRENALAFFVTPTGSRFDAALSNDLVGPNSFNVSWNAYWDGASTRNELGWFAEIRVPFTTLPFEVIDGKVIMGITSWRYYARGDEIDIFPPSDLSMGDEFRPALSQRFVFEGIVPQNPIHITPYVLGGFEETNILNDKTSEYENVSKFKRELGLDAKVALGSNATLDLTINTDFAQVEADNQQINLTRLNLFFPEKRLFFQERASLFNFDFGVSDRLFHSRRIGIVDGKQTRIYGGVRAIGKFGGWEAGVLTMQTAPQGDLNSENFGVVRLRKNVLNENSTVGAIVTNRGDFKNNYNSVYGLDANLRIFEENYLSLRWAQSFTNQKENKISSLNPTKLFMEISKRNLQGFTYVVNYGRAGEDYNPAMGFEQRENFSQLNYDFSYNMFPGKNSKTLRYSPNFIGSHTWGNQTNKLESRNLILGFTMFSKAGWFYDLSLNNDKELLYEPLSLSGGIELEQGIYEFNSINGMIQTPAANKLFYLISGSVGNFYDGKKTTIMISPSINITPDLSIGGSFIYNYLTFSKKSITKHIQLSRINILYTYSTKLTFSALVQHNSITKTLAGNFRIRYNPKEGNDFYLVYNGDLNQNRNREIPILPISNVQTILLKYSHTFHL